MRLSVLIASYKRPSDLERCLAGFERQSRVPDEIVIVLRDSDFSSWKKIKEIQERTFLPLRTVSVSASGVIAANNAALPTIHADLISFIDDDACPASDWMQKIENYFISDPNLGALGGRDRFAHPKMLEETELEAKEVGQLRWYGKIINYHHRRFPFVAPADSLKGCNMTFRRSLVNLCDVGLKGNACYYELDLCFRVKKAGFKILFDGNLLVDHYLSENHLDSFRRGELHPARVYNDYHNRSRVLLGHIGGIRWWVVAFYWLAAEPQFALLRFLRDRYPHPFLCWKEAMRGSWSGFRGIGSGVVINDPASATLEALSSDS